MAGHSQFKNIMYRKGAQDAKRAKQFSKLIREITVVARAGADTAANPRLRSALQAARAANMPKDTIDRAIKKATGAGNEAAFEEVRYEGYGPGGVAIIVEALTDNHNRTAANVRAAFNKYGGSLGETNSVAFLFDRAGMIEYAAAAATPEDMFEAALEAGAEDVDSGERGHEVRCAPGDLGALAEALEARFGPPLSARLDWRPQSTVVPDEGAADTLLKLLEVLEDSDDVQHIAANYEISNEVMERLSA